MNADRFHVASLVPPLMKVSPAAQRMNAAAEQKRSFCGVRWHDLLGGAEQA
jgi:hypothetical protein